VQSPLQRTSGYCRLGKYSLFTVYITQQQTMWENYRAFNGEAGRTNSYHCILKVKHYWENRGWCSSWRDTGWVQPAYKKASQKNQRELNKTSFIFFKFSKWMNHLIQNNEPSYPEQWTILPRTMNRLTQNNEPSYPEQWTVLPRTMNRLTQNNEPS